MAVAASVVAVQTLVGGLNVKFGQRPFLDPDLEGSLFQYLSVSATLAAGVLVLRLASHAHALRRYALGFILLAFGLDDLFAVHERLGEGTASLLASLHTLPEHAAVRVWLVLLAPLLLLALWLLLRELRQARRDARMLLAFGLSALAAAVAVELVGLVTRAPTFIAALGFGPEHARLLLEEGLELGGWTLIAGGFYLGAVSARAASEAQGAR